MWKSCSWKGLLQSRCKLHFVSAHLPEPSAESVSGSGEIAALKSELAHAWRDHESLTLMGEAVFDTQGTIRAIDTKVGILLAALAIPLPYVMQAISTTHMRAVQFSVGLFFGWLALIAYVVAGFVAIRALTGTGNAAAHLSRAHRPPDVFYLGGLYRLGWFDAAFNRRNNVSQRSLDDVVLSVPRDADGLLRVLTNELMTLAYIRDVKLHRQRVAFELTAVAFVLAILAMLL